MIPGEYFIEKGEIECNSGRPVIKMTATNTGDRPIQVGSHCHFFEINPQMVLYREKAFGKRLNIPAGTSVRFEPGEEKEVELVPFAGARRIFGTNNLTNGDTTSKETLKAAMQKLRSKNFKNKTS
jgi:urease beta subunit